MDPIAAIFIAIAVMGITLLLFGGWLVAVIIKGISQAVTGLISPSRATSPRRLPTAPGQVRCPRPQCHKENPKSAAYCRRCGKRLGELHQPAAASRRAAVL